MRLLSDATIAILENFLLLLGLYDVGNKPGSKSSVISLNDLLAVIFEQS